MRDETVSGLALAETFYAEAVAPLVEVPHADDVMVNFTDWPARLTREYRDLLTQAGEERR
ncbi:MAG: hypothetical protein R2722_14750 [Tessaracoccus sp.]